MEGVNHNHFLVKMRWKIANKEIKYIKTLKLDCYKFVFIKQGISEEKQQILIDFMNDSDTLNSLQPSDFCNMFINEKIPFELKFCWCDKRGFMHNLKSLINVIGINKQLKLL